MGKNIVLEILPNGSVRFRRGDKDHNDSLKELLSMITDDDGVVKELEEFFKQSEDIELLYGDTIFCG